MGNHIDCSDKKAVEEDQPHIFQEEIDRLELYNHKVLILFFW